MKTRGKKLTLNSVVMGNVRRRGRQNSTLALGVVLAVFFLSASLFGASCLLASVEAQNVRDLGRADIFMWDVPDDLMEQFEAEGRFSETAEMEVLYASDELGSDAETWFTVGRYTPPIDEIQHYQLLEGRFPETQGEIAMESSILLRMRLDIEPGDEITLRLHGYDGEGPMAQEQEMRFTLVGILDKKGAGWDKRWHSYYNDREHMFLRAPEVLVSAEEPVQPGCAVSRMLTGIFARPSGGRPIHEAVYAYEEAHDCLVYYSTPDQGGFSELGEDKTMIIGFIAVFLALTAAAMAGIANALTANIDRRKGQIGMLRAIGATRTQIRRILRRETIMILLITLPAGVLAAVGALKILERQVGGWFVWSVPAWMIAADIIACALCVTAASAASVRRSVRITPMQAVRDIDLTRSFLRLGEKSKRKFVPHRLIAKRASTLRRSRSAGMTVLLAAGAIMFSVSVMMVADYGRTYPEEYDISISDMDDLFMYSRWNYGGFLNENVYTGRFTYGDLYEIEALPHVDRVSAVVVKNVNVHLDEITDYITAGHFSEAGSYAFNEAYGHGRMGVIVQGLDVTDPASAPYDDFDRAYADYQAVKERFGIEDELLVTSIVGLDRVAIEQLHEHAYQGVIDVEKILSGEEVLVIAPARWGAAWEWQEGASSSRFYYDESRDLGLDEYVSTHEKPEDYTFTPLYENDVFFVGDTLDIEIWNSGGECEYEDDMRIWPEDIARDRRTVKIGALLDEHTNLGYGSQFTIVTSRVLLGDAGLSEVRVCLEDGLDDETHALVSEEISRIAARSGAYFYDRVAQVQENERTQRMVLIVCAVVCSLLFAFTWAMLSNAVSGRIRSEIRQIGTMRAVGASMRTVLGSYVWQFYRVFLWGGLSAWAISALLNFYLFGRYRTWSYYLSVQLPLVLVTPVYCLPMLILCVAGAYMKLRPVFRSSVVENIRVL